MSANGKVLRFTRPPRRSVVLAERVKVRKRLSRAGGIWRLTLSCEHVVLALEIVEDIAGASPPERVACWRCLAAGAP